MGPSTTFYTGELRGTPLGDLWLAVTELGLAAVAGRISRIEFETYLFKRFKHPVELAPARTSAWAAQLDDYLNGQRRNFSLVIDWSALRPFQQAVLQATCAIPYGETRTYKEISEQAGSPHGARAVGQAEATNPMPLVIPCHRVIGSDGRLHGYGLAEGVRTKEWLLRLEGALIA